MLESGEINPNGDYLPTPTSSWYSSNKESLNSTITAIKQNAIIEHGNVIESVKNFLFLDITTMDLMDIVLITAKDAD